MIITCKNKIIANDVEVADTFLKRFIGLMGRKDLKNNQGLLIKKCSSIHCFFMKITIDAVYLSKDMTVLAIETLKPWTIGSFIKDTAHVLELSEGNGRTMLDPGDKITLSRYN